MRESEKKHREAERKRERLAGTVGVRGSRLIGSGTTASASFHERQEASSQRNDKKAQRDQKMKSKNTLGGLT